MPEEMTPAILAAAEAMAKADPFVAEVLEPSEIRALARVALAEAAALHDARVSELLAANNRDVERRRAAEAGSARLRGGLERLLQFAEATETKALVGDEGCLWPVEEARLALAEEAACG